MNYFICQTFVYSMCHKITFPLLTKASRGQTTSKLTSHISLAENRNLLIDFVSFTELFARTPDTWMFSRLSIINVSFCDIKSPLLSNMLYLSQLTTCDFRGNNFYGTIPGTIMDNSMLTYLDFSKNNFSGSLPNGILSLKSLQTLDISGNPYMREGQAHPPIY